MPFLLSASVIPICCPTELASGAQAFTTKALLGRGLMLHSVYLLTFAAMLIMSNASGYLCLAS